MVIKTNRQARKLLRAIEKSKKKAKPISKTNSRTLDNKELLEFIFNKGGKNNERYKTL